MNVERLINMIVRRLMRKAVSKGMHAATGGNKGMTKDQRQSAKRNRQAMKVARRVSKF